MQTKNLLKNRIQAGTQSFRAPITGELPNPRTIQINVGEQRREEMRQVGDLLQGDWRNHLQRRFAGSDRKRQHEGAFTPFCFLFP